MGWPLPTPAYIRHCLAQNPSLRYASTDGEKTQGRKMLLPHEGALLADQQLRDASLDQLEDLVQRINLAQQGRGLPGVMWQQPRADVPGQPAPGESTERPASD